MRFSNDPKDIGTKLGPKMVHLISETIVHTKRKLLDTEHRARVHSMQEIIDRAGREIADLYRPVWQESMQEMDMPDHLRDHMEKIVSGTHQWQAIAGVALGYSGAGNALSTIISNGLAPTVRAVMAKDPQLVPQPDELVKLGVTGSMDWDFVTRLCEGQGYSQDIIAALRSTAYTYPDLTTILELLRRDFISINDAELYMNKNGIFPDVQNILLKLASTPLSPADLADMVVRGIKTESEAAPIAVESGVDHNDFHDLTLLTGEPPGLMQLLEGYRRGFIDKATLEHGIRQSRYRNEWLPLLEKLRYSPMSVADAVNASVQNHMSLSEASAIADQNGLEPGAFQTLYETAGEPLSRTEMEELYNRGLVTEDDVKQALRESRVKNKYIDLAFQLHQRIVPAQTLSRALRYGAITHAEAVRKAMDYGYSAKDAELIVNSGSMEKLQPYRNRVVSAVETAYENNTIPHADAVSLISDMGYDQSEAEFILKAAEFRRSEKIVSQVATNVRSRYVGHAITRQQASNDLDAIGIPSQQRDYMLGLWDIEYQAHVRHLTEAQVVKAVKLKLIAMDDGLSRLEAMGYDAVDAELLIQGA